MQKTNNFLNNQRYVLGKSEEKKILMLYFGKKRYMLFLKILTYFSTFLLSIIVFSSFFYLGIKVFFTIDKFLSFIFFLLSLSYIYLSILSFKHIKPVFFIKDYFFLDYQNKIFVFFNIILYILIGFCLGVFPLYYNSVYFHSSASQFLPGYIVYVGFLIYVYSKIDENVKKGMNVINLVNLFFFPISLLIGVIIYLFSYILASVNKNIVLKRFRKNKTLYNDFYEITKK